MREQIRSGQWLTGDRLPSESELMDAHQVSRITVRHALADLASLAQCARLKRKAPSAILRVERTVFTLADQALHHERSVYHPSAFSYRLSLAR